MGHLVEHLRRPGLQRAAPEGTTEGAYRTIWSELPEAAGKSFSNKLKALADWVFGSWNLVEKSVPSRLAEHERTDQGEQPQRQNQPTMAETKARQTLHSSLLDR